MAGGPGQETGEKHAQQLPSACDGPDRRDAYAAAQACAAGAAAGGVFSPWVVFIKQRWAPALARVRKTCGQESSSGSSCFL